MSAVYADRLTKAEKDAVIKRAGPHRTVEFTFARAGSGKLFAHRARILAKT